MTYWTEQQYNEYIRNRRSRPKGIVRRRKPMVIPVQADGQPADGNTESGTEFARKPKYRNSKVTVDGHVFDSVREATVYNGLKMSEEAGVITDLELQPRFLLQPSFKDREGKTQRAITYFADFRYKEKDGHTVVVDVKSRITAENPVYRLKKKMLMYRFPDIDFREMF